jgi:hypothetical protein
MLGAILSKIGIATTRLTAARATKLEANCDATVSLLALASTAVSSANMTTGRIAKMDRLLRPVFPKIQALEIASRDIAAGYAPTGNISSSFASESPLLTNDYQFGFRVLPLFTDSSDVLVTALNVTGSGYLLACIMTNYLVEPLSCQITLTIDGVLIADSTLSILTQNYFRVLYGGLHGAGSYVYPCLSRIPVRFESNLIVQHRASSTNIKTSVVYLID